MVTMSFSWYDSRSADDFRVSRGKLDRENCCLSWSNREEICEGTESPTDLTKNHFQIQRKSTLYNNQTNRGRPTNTSPGIPQVAAPRTPFPDKTSNPKWRRPWTTPHYKPGHHFPGLLPSSLDSSAALQHTHWQKLHRFWKSHRAVSLC